MRIYSAFAVVLLFICLFYCCVETTSPDTIVPKTYVGSNQCQSCHAKEYANFAGSDHAHAMDTALPRSVKGDFNNSQFIYYGDTARFYQKGGQYYVHTKDATGIPTEFKVSFTFGWKPLQQYLVQFPDGRVQTLPYCWDTRPKENGGQRWFHIYGKDKVLPGDELFWTGINQNWNNMCADCHTTNYAKKFDITSNTFHSTWGEGNVSCESCHGPASGHLAWTGKKPVSDSLKGFAFNLAGEHLNWTMNAEKGIAFPDKKIQKTAQIETCARCHSRATRITDVYNHGQSFLQSHIPSTVSTVNYHIDGQIREEDYEYGSFLQSKMYANGVTCVNCHDAHSMKLKLPGNETCNTCHSPAKFNVEAHTHHPENSVGASCANCHMPVSTYMGVDDRRDHSIRIPRPDLSLTIGTPNACNKCHTDKPVSWTAKAFSEWYGDKLPKAKTYGEHLYTISKNGEGSEDSWKTLMASPDFPAIIKATVLEQYTSYLSPANISERKNNLQSADPNLRLNAIRSVAAFPAEEALALVKPMLNDPVLSVRTEVINVLAPQYAALDAVTQQRFDQVMSEYLSIQRSMSDRPEGYLNQGIVFASTGRAQEAEQIYQLGLKRFPKFIALYANLADLFRAMGNDAGALELLQKGLLLEPGNGTLHYSLAMWYFRNKDQKNGMAELEKAVVSNPADPGFTYTKAIALHSTGESGKAVQWLEKFRIKYGNQPQILEGLIALNQDLKQPDQVAKYLKIRQTVFGY
jgi:tetratricopeptide (TPR) repeat protein